MSSPRQPLQLRMKLNKQVFDALLPSFDPLDPFHPLGHASVPLHDLFHLLRGRNARLLLLVVIERRRK